MTKDERQCREDAEREEFEAADREFDGGEFSGPAQARQRQREIDAKGRRIEQARRRKAREAVMRSLGLTKVKGAVSGKTYWE